MRDTGEQDVIDLARRVGKRLHQRRMAMPVQDRPPRRDGVDHPPTVGELEEFVVSTNTWQRVIVTKQRCIRMPDRAAIVSDNRGYHGLWRLDGTAQLRELITLAPDARGQRGLGPFHGWLECVD